ncbi:hypothetical protein HYDPIDRAFT_117900 [Hydnomerulius pinastri MD-312]|uniref:DUF6699 domain-containing protein n=1 Tax=Hydnomerulius pinastri MD-312 TaxID=994086 RepID=A0A0C9W9K0_9AGAM|nr:hypothetical protein HYDPIDRAFT_117900 [Hydnomerulius pinastri MD-312]
MSSPYVYTPAAYEPTPYLGYGTYQQRSPFIPPATLFPSSPYTPTSPYLGGPTTPRGVHYDDSYWNPPPRARRPSWHAGMAPSPFLQAPQTPGRDRRRSFGEGHRPWGEPAAPWGYPGTSPRFQIHPLLNGEAPRMDFYFDLASPSFSPLRWIGPGQSAVISPDELREPATYPSITRMRITHDAIPDWPVDLEYQHDAYTVHTTPLPITLGDVLYMIHSSLHRQITHQDWARLSLSEETAIARAYTRRCRSVPSAAQVEASQGVKRVDYLLEKHIFRGLIRTHDEDGFYQWRLITG